MPMLIRISATILTFVLTFPLSSFCYDFGAKQAQPPACDDSGCVIFEVTVHINTHGGQPYLKRVLNGVPISENQSAIVETSIYKLNDTCTKSVKVPFPIYQSITSILGQLAGEEGDEVPPILTPTQQSLMIFYSTLMQQTMNFQCTPRDLKMEEPTAPISGSAVIHKETSPRLWALRGIVQSGTATKVVLANADQVHLFVVDEEVSNGWRIILVEQKNRFILIQNGNLKKKIFIGDQFEA